MKRLFDIVFSIIGLLVFSIPMVTLYVLFKYKEPHPFLFKQIRIGKNKVPFNVLKIQTMVDGQITPIGKKIRETGIDEIPQFINVLKGDMSIVGPRALPYETMESMGWNDAYHAKRWSVRPGITGFAQMYAKHQSKASYLLDCKYIAKSNIVLDFALLCITFLINIFGKNRVLRVLFHRNLVDND